MDRSTEATRRYRPALPALPIPELLQTPEYARQLVSAADISGPRDAPSAVAARTQHREALYTPDRTFGFTPTEPALRRRPHHPGVLAAQQDQLTRHTQEWPPSATANTMRDAGHRAMLGTANILDYAGMGHASDVSWHRQRGR
ncbi:Scr1 family TA system antitoxin-like transcriptional regulator [Nocardiopsis kunsanensis]|uniref:Scr1 family TA system antitoxin-like transcriptional regulator n=1 Tax=Nocardiopsis kunsanensis TaxID=141693 RepID=UPI00373AEB95